MSNNPVGNLPSGTLYTLFNTKEYYMTWFHSDSEKLQLPNRHCLLPDIYQVRNHIKAPRYGSYLGKLYIALIDSSPGHINKVAQYLETAQCPNGTAEGIIESGIVHSDISILSVLTKFNTGYLTLRPGDCLFARDLRGSLSEADNRIQAFVTPR